VGEGDIFHGDDFQCGGKLFFFGGGELFIGKFNLEEFSKILIRKYFYLSYFFFVGSVLLVEMLRVINRGKFSQGLNLLEYLSMKGSFFVAADTGWVPRLCLQKIRNSTKNQLFNLK